MRKITKFLIGILLLLLIGCSTNNKNTQEEHYMIGHTFDNNKVIHLAFDIPYNTESLSAAFSNQELTLNDFINKLDYIDTLKDGGSKIYKYNKINRIFGEKDFYVIVCNSFDDDHNIYVAEYKESLNDKCSIKIDDLKSVSMIIKEGTLTKTGTTIIITDKSGKNNIYGESYRIDKKESDKWVALEPIIDNYAWNTIGYTVDENNTLELNINWEWIYGTLKEGEYRLVKDTSEPGEEPPHYITTEFVIK